MNQAYKRLSPLFGSRTDAVITLPFWVVIQLIDTPLHIDRPVLIDELEKLWHTQNQQNEEICEVPWRSENPEAWYYRKGDKLDGPFPTQEAAEADAKDFV